MNGDDGELRQRLQRADPAGNGASPPRTSLTAQDLLERAMQIIDQDETRPDDRTTRTAAPRSWLRTPVLVGAGTVAAAVAAVGVVVAVTDDPAGSSATTLALTVPDPTSMASCLVFDVDVLGDMQVALAGTATEVTEDEVTIEVDRWYTGGSADTVTIGSSSGVALDGVSFELGGSYLVTATDGVVNGCGYSGPADPELQAAYEEAFGG